MNLSVLKLPGTWITLITSLVALLVSTGVILQGSTAATVGGWIVAILGIVTGHAVTASGAAPADASAAPKS